MDILAPAVIVAVCASAASAELSELARLRRLAQVPDNHAFIKRRVRVAAPTWRNPLEGRHHFRFSDDHLDGPCVGWAYDELRDCGLVASVLRPLPQFFSGILI